MRIYPSRSVRTLLLAVPVSALLFAFAGSPLAGADTGASGSATTEVITMVFEKGKMKFVGADSVAKGDQLEIVNDTSPRQTGPHTFSLVTKGSLPKTKPARQRCFTPRRICLAIAKWHGLQPRSDKVTINPVEAGAPGWSTLGTPTKKGDSWFTEEKGEAFSQEVAASAPPTLHFICAVHPWMQGRVDVLPAPTS